MYFKTILRHTNTQHIHTRTHTHTHIHKQTQKHTHTYTTHTPKTHTDIHILKGYKYLNPTNLKWQYKISCQRALCNTMLVFMEYMHLFILHGIDMCPQSSHHGIVFMLDQVLNRFLISY